MNKHGGARRDNKNTGLVIRDKRGCPEDKVCTEFVCSGLYEDYRGGSFIFRFGQLVTLLKTPFFTEFIILKVCSNLRFMYAT